MADERDSENKFVIPAWMIIKRKVVDWIEVIETYLDYARVSDDVNRVRWLDLFKSHLIKLYSYRSDEINSNNKVKVEAGKLKDINKYIYNMNELKYTDALTYWVSLKQALFKLGYTDIGIKKEAPDEIL